MTKAFFKSFKNQESEGEGGGRKDTSGIAVYNNYDQK
jgi:hypothetical protein